jgi:hypothetical protein
MTVLTAGARHQVLKENSWQYFYSRTMLSLIHSYQAQPPSAARYLFSSAPGRALDHHK